MKTHDYVSANLNAVDLRYAFPEMIPGDRAKQNWPYLRREIRHTWYVDRRNPTVGFVSQDEAAILYNTAKLFVEKPCLEIGCWRGWSTAHIALGCRGLDVIDSALADESFLNDVCASMERAGVLKNICFHTDSSPEAVHRLSREREVKWSFAFIDGNHEGETPRRDAEAVLQYAAKDALIAFHDLASPDVSAGLFLLAEEGWNTRIYQTMQIMGVAWRGDITPIDHVPDPSMTWNLPAHLQALDHHRGRSNRVSRTIGDGTRNRTDMTMKADVYADGFSALQQRYVSLTERYETLAAREEQAQLDSRRWQDQHADADKAREELEQFLTEKLTQKSTEMGELRAALDAERVGRLSADRALAEALSRAAQAEDGIMDLVATKQDLALARMQLEKMESARKNADIHASTAGALAERQSQMLLVQTKIAEELALKVAKLTADVGEIDIKSQPIDLYLKQISDLERVKDEFLKFRNFDSSFRNERASIGHFANWATTTRVLLGLLRRRMTGSAQSACQIAIDYGLGAGLPADVAAKVGGWLTSRRVLLGLLRRNARADRATSLAIVVSTLYWSISNKTYNLEETNFEVHELLDSYVNTSHTRVDVAENLPHLGHGESSTDLNHTQDIEREIARLREIEQARSSEEAELTDLRVELEVLRHHAKLLKK